MATEREMAETLEELENRVMLDTCVSKRQLKFATTLTGGVSWRWERGLREVTS